MSENPFAKYARKKGQAPAEQQQVNPFAEYSKKLHAPLPEDAAKYPGNIDIPTSPDVPADWMSPQNKALRRQQYDLARMQNPQEDTWRDKIRGGIEAGGGLMTTLVASVPGIPYGVLNAVQKKIFQPGQTSTEDEIIKGIGAFTPSALMPHSHLGQKYLEDIGTALQGIPVMGAEGAAIGSGSKLMAQFARAKAETALGGKEPLTITPLTIASKANNTTPELHAEIVKHETQGTINPVVAQRHIDADALPTVLDENGRELKVRLTKGMATQDSKILSDEKNVRSAADPVRQVMDDNGKAMPLVLDKLRSQVAPDINFRNAPEEGQFYIDRLNQVRDKLQARTREDYQALHDAAESSGLTETPLDAEQFSSMLQDRFGKLGLFHEDLPPSVNMRVQKIASGELPLTFKSFEQLRTILGREQRKAAANTGEGSASAAHAIGEVRDVLENLPLTKEAQVLKPLADKARASAKLDFDLQNRSPAYKAVVNETAIPDNFVDKYILGTNKNTASQQHIKNLIAMFPDDNEFNQALAYSALNDIKNQSVNAKGLLSSAKLDKSIKLNEDSGKHELLLPVPIRDGLDKLNKTAQLVQGAPAGAYIQTNPNLAATLSHYINSGAYKMASSIPLVGEPIANLKQAFQAKKFSTESTKPGAGLDYPVRK